MSDHEKLVDELARLIWVKAGLDYTASDLCERAPDAARAVLELVAARLAEPTDAMRYASRFSKETSARIWCTMLAFSPLYPSPSKEGTTDGA